MEDSAKTKQQLLDELAQLRQQLKTLPQLAEELRLKEQILDSALDSILLHEVDGKIVYANETAYRLHGYTKEQFLGMNIRQLLPPSGAKLFGQRNEGILEKGSAKFEATHILKDGSTIQVEVAARAIESSGKKFIVSVDRDIRERKKAEAELRLKEQILDNATDSILLRELDGTIIYANEMTYQPLGHSKEEFIGKKLYRFLHPEGANLVEARTREMLEKGRLTFETAYLRKNGSLMSVEVNARVIESGGKKLILAITRDITERKEMQDRLVITDRLAALGEMAQGFAHELNNPLTAVIGYAQLLLEDTSLSEKMRTDLDRIHSQSQRVATIIRNFMVFAHSQAPLKQPTELNMVINNVLKLREYEQKNKNIKVITHLSADLPAVMADASQLQQVFLDIVMNAEHFMLKAHNQGTLTITTERTGDIVKASIADDGPGIPQENLSKIFNPFFTTKEVGQGTGLGLSICHSIIAEHGGKIYAESEPGKGATFVIELPVARG